MDADMEHEQYFSEHPHGDHPEPAGETLRFMEKQNEINEKVSENMTEVKLSLVRIEEKVERTLEQTTRTNGRVTKQEAFTEAYKPMLEEIKEERGSRKMNVSNIFWDVIRAVVIGVIAAGCGLLGLKLF